MYVSKMHVCASDLVRCLHMCIGQVLLHLNLTEDCRKSEGHEEPARSAIEGNDEYLKQLPSNSADDVRLQPNPTHIAD